MCVLYIERETEMGERDGDRGERKRGRQKG